MEGEEGGREPGGGPERIGEARTEMLFHFSFHYAALVHTPFHWVAHSISFRRQLAAIP
jgi:hypothetical protein